MAQCYDKIGANIVNAVLNVGTKKVTGFKHGWSN